MLLSSYLLSLEGSKSTQRSIEAVVAALESAFFSQAAVRGLSGMALHDM